TSTRSNGRRGSSARTSPPSKPRPARGLDGYRVFDVTPDFQPTVLGDRAEYYPVLYEERFHVRRRAVGLALGRYDGRRLPMEKAAEAGRPVATLPVRPIGPDGRGLVYLLFWPVYDTIQIPTTPGERRARLLGYSVGNYELAALLTPVARAPPEILGTPP